MTNHKELHDFNDGLGPVPARRNGSGSRQIETRKETDLTTPVLTSALLVVVVIAASPAAAATWFQPAQDLVRIGACGSGGAVVADGCNPVVVAGQPELVAFGQNLEGGWNSQDTDAALWSIEDEAGFTALRLRFVDLHDQPSSFARVTIDGAEWNFARGANAEVREIDLSFGDLRTSVLVLVETRRNDGFSVNAMACRPDA